MKGFFIPLEFGKLKLTQIEEKLLATYRYYTLKGDYHNCALTNKKLAEMLFVNERSIQRAKKHLKELGYIKTNGGIRVWYVGIDIEETETVDEVDEVNETVDEVDKQVEEQVNKTEITENQEVIEEETDNKTNNKTDIVMEKSKSNVEKVIESLDPFYQDPEKLKYFYEKCKVWVELINNLNPNEFNYSMAVTGIKSCINKEFGYPEVKAIPNQNKKEVKSEEFESCFI